MTKTKSITLSKKDLKIISDALNSCMYWDYGSYDTYGRSCGTFRFNQKLVNNAKQILKK